MRVSERRFSIRFMIKELVGLLTESAVVYDIGKGTEYYINTMVLVGYSRILW
jgi:hypothetical protein